MKEKLYRAICANPGQRKRFYASELHCWQGNQEFLKAFYELLGEGYIFRRLHNDLANMEYYDLWYPVPEWEREG